MDFRPSSVQGILYAEDFDFEPAPPVIEPEPYQPPALTQADIDEACTRAVEAAQAAWTRSNEQRRTEALAALTASLAASRATATEHAEAVADSVARTALSMVAGILPHLCRTHGDTEVRVLVKRLVPTLAPRNHLVIRTHADLIEVIRADIETLDDTLAAAIELRPANLQPGDVRLTWENGSLNRDTGAIVAAMEEGLAQLGLLDLPNAPNLQHVPNPKQVIENRSLACAQ